MDSCECDCTNRADYFMLVLLVFVVIGGALLLCYRAHMLPWEDEDDLKTPLGVPVNREVLAQQDIRGSDNGDESFSLSEP